MEAGNVRSTSPERLVTPTVLHMVEISVSEGPMCRRAKVSRGANTEVVYDFEGKIRVLGIVHVILYLDINRSILFWREKII